MKQDIIAMGINELSQNGGTGIDKLERKTGV